MQSRAALVKATRTLARTIRIVVVRSVGRYFYIFWILEWMSVSVFVSGCMSVYLSLPTYVCHEYFRCLCLFVQVFSRVCESICTSFSASSSVLSLCICVRRSECLCCVSLYRSFCMYRCHSLCINKYVFVQCMWVVCCFCVFPCPSLFHRCQLPPNLPN